MNCDFCGSCGKMKMGGEILKTKKTLHFCDKSCYNAYVRDDTREGIENVLQHTKKRYEDDDKECVPLSKLLKVRILFYQSLLHRKPRAELFKLVDLHKRILCDLIELAHDNQEDQMNFILGEMFKQDFKWLIGVWGR